MSTYQYEAMNSVGQVVKGDVEAGSSEEAVSKIRGMGHFPTKIKERSGRKSSAAAATAGVAAAPATRTRQRTAGRVSKKLLTQFARQLSTLQDAGLPLLRSLRILEEQQKPGMLRVAIRLVAEDVEGGSTLSEAMARHPKAFDKLFSNMVAAGEAGGVLDVVLRRLADFMEASQKLKRRITGAMIYPIVVIVAAVSIVMGIMVFIIPRFKSIFEQFGAGELPGVTLLLMRMSDWLTKEWGWAYILAFPFALFVIFKLLRLSDGGRYFVDSLKLKIPVMGKILAKTAVSRFTRTLGTLLTAGVPILEAINITRETSGNEVFAKALSRVHDGIREGDDFADPLRQAKIVEPMVVNMIDVGEETGDLDKMLGRIADTYDEEVQTLVAAMVSLLEPVMVITLGVIVGFIVVAIFMPLPKLIASVKK
ncbi:MAG: type II secretion system F family protein [Planctomycetota bacterium]|nr:type II secretion system F family protein [Planctomycetota bacterium]